MGFLKSPEFPLEGLIKIPLERLIKIPLEGNFFRFPRESEKTRTRAVGFLKTPEIPLEGNFFRFPREAEKSRTKAVRFLKSTEIPLEGLIFHPLHVADWPRVILVLIYRHTFFSTIDILVLIWFSMQRTYKEFLVRTKAGRGKTSLQ